MNFITTILNMRYNYYLVGSVFKYFINAISFMGSVLVGPGFPAAVKRGSRLHKSIFPPTTCTDMVIWGAPYTLGSTANLPKFTNYLRNFVHIPNYLLGIFIGCMLGDAYMDNREGRVTRFSLKQSIINFPFL